MAELLSNLENSRSKFRGFDLWKSSFSGFYLEPKGIDIQYQILDFGLSFGKLL